MKINELRNRTQIPKYTKVLEEDKNSNVVRTQKTKLYEYYKCDYCNDEIRLDKKPSERSGGIVTFPHILTKSGSITLVLCNKCLKPVLKIFEENNIERI